MGWYKQACPKCWDNHDGLTCEQYQAKTAHWRSVNEAHRLMREQNDLLRRISDNKVKQK